MRRYSLVLTTSCLALALFGCNSSEDHGFKELPAIPVIVTPPLIQDITVYLESIGTLQASVSIEIKPQTSGALSEVLVKEGQLVKKGDSLFKIDPTAYAIKVQEAEAQLNIDMAGFKAAQKKMARFQDLAKRDLVSQIEWDELKAQQQKAQASVELDTARLKFAQLELDRCTLQSPIDGRIGKLDAHPGLLVSSGQADPLGTVSTLDPLTVEFTVTEKEFPMLPQEDLEVNISPLCSSNAAACPKSLVTFLDNHFDEATGLLLIRGKVDNPGHALRPGQSVRVLIPIASTPNAKLIPQKTIRYNQHGPYVYVVNDDLTVAIRQLLLGKEQDSNQIVLEGLNDADRVVLDGHLRLSPGSKVEIKS